MLYHLDRNEKLLIFFRILITAVLFKVQKWISKTVYCISCSVVCKIVFSSKFPDILDNADRVTRRRRRKRRKTRTISKCFAFYANAKILSTQKLSAMDLKTDDRKDSWKKKLTGEHFYLEQIYKMLELLLYKMLFWYIFKYSQENNYTGIYFLIKFQAKVSKKTRGILLDNYFC